MNFKIKTQSDKDVVKSYIDRLSSEKEFEVSITQKKNKRSISQNALYHIWLNCIAKETGNDVECLHKLFARKYLGYKSVEIFGETINVVQSTTKLDTENFTNYLDQIQMFCETELNIILPFPTDRFYQQFVEQYEIGK